MYRHHHFSSTVFLLVLFGLLAGIPSIASAQRTTPRPPMSGSTGVNPGGMSNLSIRGYVTEAGSYGRVENAQVELHSFSGPIVATTFTQSNGEFEFSNLRAGSYFLVVRPIDHEATTQPVDLTAGSAFGVEVEVQARASESSNRKAPDGRPTVTVRDLAVPERAQEALAKGMTLLYRKSDFTGSVKEFQRAIKAYPDFAEAYAQMGVAYAQTGNIGACEAALRKAVALGQDRFPPAYWVLAGILSGQNRFADAEPLARKAVDLAPHAWQSNFELARALLGLNRAPEAESPAQAAVDAQPNNPVPYLELANVHGQLRKFTAQLDNLNQYLRLAPSGQYASEVRTRRDQLQQFLAKNELPQTAPQPPK